MTYVFFVYKKYFLNRLILRSTSPPSRIPKSNATLMKFFGYKSLLLQILNCLEPSTKQYILHKKLPMVINNLLRTNHEFPKIKRLH